MHNEMSFTVWFHVSFTVRIPVLPDLPQVCLSLNHLQKTKPPHSNILLQSSHKQGEHQVGRSIGHCVLIGLSGSEAPAVIYCLPSACCSISFNRVIQTTGNGNPDGDLKVNRTDFHLKPKH